ncbi:YjfK family protein [Psychrosphaera aquimarina]|uniref:YjfK family protein n=1 Tax=Psychrosphaera aquimarina TaxID=2044854 RepID=A0ABU3R2D4_9GAMM|nr:YjfK family protein [Psychrosphaera aquimarina]MDU0113842.1 YjfK family protein [Psychrosphaera aquimarina]
MFSKIFGKKEKVNPLDNAPSIMGLRIGGSFDIDPLLLRLTEGELTISGCAPTQIIQAAGIVDLDGTWVYRFYTDDEAYLQVITEGGQNDEHVVDVKLFHFYDTQDIESKPLWDEILNTKIGTPTYQLESQTFERVWTSASDYHNPVHMAEKTFDETGESSETDQFTMLFERPISGNNTESLFISAEEKLEEAGYLSRCLVISTGISISSAQITIHG